MLNIWHIFHTKPILSPFIRYLAHIPHQTHFKPIYQIWYMLNFLQLATVKSQIYIRTEQSGILIYYFLFLFQPSFLLQLTASISFSTLPFFFFFPLPRCSIVFPFLKKSHHQFRFYHHWSNHIKSGFFPPFWFALSSVLPASVWVISLRFGCAFAEDSSSTLR